MSFEFIYQYARPAVTATTVVLSENDKILIGLRHPNANAYPNYWCVPGGFLDAKIDLKHIYCRHEEDSYPVTESPVEMVEAVKMVRKGETLKEAGARELFEEAGIVVLPSELRTFEEYSDPDLDPRDHVVNVAFRTTVFEDTPLTAGDDVIELRWIERWELDDYEFAFNHRQIIEDCFANR